ncbi:MAG: nitroreductase family protein [Deltaproteobacteria bacterium]|nr:nitroreductase family protein [Deltaproteobacteria bacterium]
MMRDLILRNRSYRRFYEDFKIDLETLKGLVDMARLSASSANLQPLKYVLSCEPGRNARIFPYLRWAGYLRDWGGPKEGERPSAYIVVLGDTNICKTINCDHGIASQSILLGAVEKGFGGCIIASVDREGLMASLNIPSRYEILLVIALGKPKEKVVIETIGPDGDVKYWRDEEKVHHVPKRRLEEVLIDLP